MKSDELRISELLASLESKGRHSPSDWHRFSKFLMAQRRQGQPSPPVPLILAASGECAASKHWRLETKRRPEENGGANHCCSDSRQHHGRGCAA